MQLIHGRGNRTIVRIVVRRRPAATIRGPAQGTGQTGFALRIPGLGVGALVLHHRLTGRTGALSQGPRPVRGVRRAGVVHRVALGPTFYTFARAPIPGRATVARGGRWGAGRGRSRSGAGRCSRRGGTAATGSRVSRRCAGSRRRDTTTCWGVARVRLNDRAAMIIVPCSGVRSRTPCKHPPGLTSARGSLWNTLTRWCVSGMRLNDRPTMIIVPRAGICSRTRSEYPTRFAVARIRRGAGRQIPRIPIHRGVMTPTRLRPAEGATSTTSSTTARAIVSQRNILTITVAGVVITHFSLRATDALNKGACASRRSVSPHRSACHESYPQQNPHKKDPSVLPSCPMRRILSSFHLTSHLLFPTKKSPLHTPRDEQLHPRIRNNRLVDSCYWPVQYTGFGTILPFAPLEAVTYQWDCPDTPSTNTNCKSPTVPWVLPTATLLPSA